MSSQRGNCAKSGSQKHQNTKAYRNDLHRKDKTIKFLNSQQITGCCKRCKEIIEWKIKYNKYKALAHPKKCVKCLQKSVTNSYFIICLNCIEGQNLCGKCALVAPIESSAETSKAVKTEINSNSASTKPKLDEENDDSDYEDESDLSNEVEQVLTINDKTQNLASIKPDETRTKEDAKSKDVNIGRSFNKRNVSFRTSESGNENERDSEEEEVRSGYEDKGKDEKIASGDSKTDDGDRDKLDEDRDDVSKSSVKVNKNKDTENEDDKYEEESSEEDGSEVGDDDEEDAD